MTPSAGEGRAFDLDRYLVGERSKVEAMLGSVLAPVLSGLPDAVAGPIVHSVHAGGKRLRPILCVTAFRACGGDPSATAAYAVAASLEIIHTYSLMHDDLPCMDDAPLRRGQPTAHTEFGSDATARAGAVLIPIAASVAWDAAEELGLPEPIRRKLLARLAWASGAEGMVGGQALDIEAEGRFLARDDIDRLHRMKTGALIRASLELGALAAEATAGMTAAVSEYGRRIGLAFQIADDVLDATSDASTLGKKPSDDALEKSTYVSLLGVVGARREAARQVDGAVAALDVARVDSPELRALGRYAVERAS